MQAIRLAQEVEINQLRQELDSCRPARAKSHPVSGGDSSREIGLDGKDNISSSNSQSNLQSSGCENEMRHRYSTPRPPHHTKNTSWGDFLNVFSIFFPGTSTPRSGHVTQV